MFWKVCSERAFEVNDVFVCLRTVRFTKVVWDYNKIERICLRDYHLIFA